ncbi:hypothetical protein DL96DRAFT_1623181 [Flagelloscypha sp. PMI_526]|nr:hypothetical protein DL96DRAFT_1623181 [Flagelloscypha sp. PMI_526]
MAQNIGHPDWVKAQKDQKKIHQKLGLDRNTIRETRDRITKTCCQCCLKSEEEIGEPFKRCKNCKTVWYCSVECQKRDWKAEHRRICTPSDHGINKYLGSLMANPMLRLQLIMAVTLFLQLQNRPQKDFDTLFCVHLHLSFEPTDRSIFFRILLGGDPTSMKSELPGRKIPSMLQEPSERKRYLWQQVRDNLVIKESFVVVVEASLKEEEDKQAKKAQPLEFVSPLKGTTKVPLTYESALSMFNTSIRLDHKDSFKLRRKDTDEEELSVIANVGRGFLKGQKEKILREKLYSDGRYKGSIANIEDHPEFLPFFER